MREVVQDFQREEEARGGDVGGPVEYARVCDFDFGVVAPDGGFLALEGGEGGTDFYDSVFSSCVDFWVCVSDVVEDVGHHSAVSGAHFVDDEVDVGEECELVVLDEVARDGLAVVGLEQLCGGVPELADVGGAHGVEGVFEGGVARAEEVLEGGFVGEGGEGEGRVGGEDDGGLDRKSVV